MVRMARYDTLRSDQLKHLGIQVFHPERFWFAAKADLAWLTTDPYVEDRKQRYTDRDISDGRRLAKLSRSSGRSGVSISLGPARPWWVSQLLPRGLQK